MCGRLRQPEIVIIASHYGEIIERLHLKTLDEIRRYKNPGAPGALVCAALVCTEVVNPNNDGDARTLSDRLMEDWGGGFEVSVWSDLPHGSGMDVYVQKRDSRHERFPLQAWARVAFWPAVSWRPFGKRQLG